MPRIEIERVHYSDSEEVHDYEYRVIEGEYPWVGDSHLSEDERRENRERWQSRYDAGMVISDDVLALLRTLDELNTQRYLLLEKLYRQTLSEGNGMSEGTFTEKMTIEGKVYQVSPAIQRNIKQLLEGLSWVAVDGSAGTGFGRDSYSPTKENTDNVQPGANGDESRTALGGDDTAKDPGDMDSGPETDGGADSAKGADDGEDTKE